MPQDQQPKTELTLDEWDESVRSHYKIPDKLWRAMAEQESGNNVNAVSPTGVRGRRQVTWATARQYGYNRDDPFEEAAASGKHLRTLYDELGHIESNDARWWGALAKYYGGGNAIDRDGNLSEQSLDGISNPLEHVNRVARRIRGAASSDSQASAAPAARATQPQPPATPAPLATSPHRDPYGRPISRKQHERTKTTEEILLGKPDPRGYDKQGRGLSTPAAKEAARRSVLTGQIVAFEDLKRQGKRDEATQVAQTIKNRWGDIMEVGADAGGWPYVKPKAKSGFTAPPLPSAAPVTTQTVDDYNRQPWLERRRRNIATGYEIGAQGLSDMLARGYDVASSALTGDFRPLAEQAEGAGRGLMKLASAFDPAGAAYEAVAPEQDRALAALERRRAERLKDDPYTIGSNVARERLAAEEAAQPGFGGAVTRGVTSGGLQALPYIGAGIVSGGSLPVLAAAGAAQSDFVRPEEAALNIAGATLPVKAGRALTPAINRAAQVLPGRMAQGAGRAAGQVGVGGGTNVAMALAAGERDPMKLVEAGTVGGLMSTVDAGVAARRGRTPTAARGVDRAVIESAARTPVRTPITVTREGRQSTFGNTGDLPRAGAQDAADVGIQQVIDRYTRRADEINRSNLDPGTKAAQLAQARAEYLAERKAARETQPPAEALQASVPEAALAQPQLPPGVRIVRQGEQIPARERGQRQIPMDVEQSDGSVETVLVLAPERINGQRVNETTLRPMVEQAMRPQVQPAAQPDVAQPEAVTQPPPPAQPSTPARRQSPPIQFTQLGPEGLRASRTPEGAIIAPESSIAGRKLLTPASGEEVLPTEALSRAVQERIAQPDPRFVTRPPQPDAPATQQIPRISQPDAATTARLPKPPIAEVNQRLIERTRARADELIEQGRFNEAVAALKAHQQALRDAKAQAKNAPGLRVQMEQQIGQAGNRIGEVRGMARDAAKGRKARENAPTAGRPRTAQAAEAALIQEPTNRIATGEGAELPRGISRPLEGQPVELPAARRKPTERLPVPKATDDNIEQLRKRQEELGRLAYDRRGDFTGDLRDEYNQLTAHIRDYDNEQAKIARGGRLEDVPPPNTRPERMIPPTGEIEARRRALDPRERFSSREDRRRGFFDTLTDDELVAEIGRLEDVRNLAIRGRSKLPPERLRANNEDLKLAVEMQKERGRIQREQGREPGERIAPRTPGRPPRKAEAEAATPPESIRALPETARPAPYLDPRLAPDQRIERFRQARTFYAERSRSGQPSALENKIAEIYATNADLDAAMKKARKELRGEFGGKLTREAVVADLQRLYKAAPTETGRKIQHSQLGEATESPDQSGVRKGQLRVIDAAGKPHMIRNPRIAGNKEAAFVKAEPRYEIPATAMPELRARPGPQFARNVVSRWPDAPSGSFAIPDLAMPELRRPDAPPSLVAKRESKGTIMGSGFGALQGLFERKAPKANPTKAEIESASLGKAVGKTLTRGGNELRTLWTSMDFSAPLSQGALLTIAHPIKGAQSFAKMFRSLSRAQSDAIDAEIAFHPLRKLGEEAGLFLATSGKLKGEAAGMEEAYRGTTLQKLPGIRHSERAYRTYLDTLRLSTWESHVKTLQADGRTFESDPKAYRQMAEFINIATGRGAVKKGGAIDKASDLMGSVLFAPRNLIANFQVLDPVRYASLAPGARKVVLRDALTAFGAMVGTAVLLKAAGVNVGFNPESDDFMVARAGNTRYDLTFGKKTQVQFLARMATGLYRKTTGEGNLPGKDPLTVAERFATGKLSPILSTAKTFATGKDFKGEKIADKSQARVAWETAAPILWRDFVEAYEQEGKKGVAKTLPAIVGARVNTYPDRAKAAFIDTPPELRAEQKRAGMARPYLQPRRARTANEKDETPGQFAARKALADEWTREYGLRLTTSEAYKSATLEERKAALEYLKRTIAGESGEKRPSLWLLNPARILQTVRESEREKRRKATAEALQ